MKKLGHAQPSERLIFSRRSTLSSAPRRAIFAAFALDEYEDASVRRLGEYSTRRPVRAETEEIPDNIIRFTTFQTSRRKA
jgi:hypothetical protein